MEAVSPADAYILIPVHNRQATTLACLHRLDQSGDLARYTVLVVDDGSTDGTAEAIQQAWPQVQVLSGDGNLWWTGAMRLAMETAIAQGADYLIWLNDDCRVAPGTIPDLVRFCRENPGAIAGAQGFELERSEQIAFGGKVKTWKGYRFITVPAGQVMPCDMLSGNLVCISRAVVQAIGYPNPQETPHYGGDSLYLLRAQKAGFQLFVDARHPNANQAGEPRLNPTNWLMAAGDAGYILRLAFNPYSGLSWRLWWRFNWQAYGAWGVVMFLKKYASLLPITALRLLPPAWRLRLLPRRAQVVAPHVVPLP